MRSRASVPILVLLAAFAALLCVLLWPAWIGNPDVSHGLFMPVVFVFLLHHSRAAGPWRYLRAGPGPAAAVAALALGGLLLLILGGLYAAAVDWSNALVSFLLASSFSCLLGAAVLAFADERVRLIPLNWASVVAAGLWPLAAPIPPGTYTRLTTGLQLWVSSGVLHALHLLGVAAFRQGNVIQLATGAVGVEEACSGVRSLVSCVFTGLFFSAALLRRTRDRVLVIALAAPLALAMNFLRSLALTLLADSGVDIAGAWHDATGYAVLGVTAVILAGLALALEHRNRRKLAVAPEVERAVPARSSDRNSGGVASALGEAAPPLRVLTVALVLSAALVAVLYANTRPGVRRGAPAPDLWAILPESQPGWTVTTSTDLYQFSAVLQTRTLAQRTYVRDGPDGRLEVILYLAYWRPGQAPVSLVATHTPDACWPGSGWVLQPQPQTRAALTADGRPLAEAEYRLFSSPSLPQYVWFWHLYDGQPITYINPYSLRRLLHIALLYGFRHDGDQLFVRVSSNRPWADFAQEPFIRRFFSRLQPLGL